VIVEHEQNEGFAQATDEGEADVMEVAGAKERNDGLWVVAERRIEIAFEAAKLSERAA